MSNVSPQPRGHAINFTDAGEVRVTAKAVDGHFNVSVVDTGPGIPEEHQARIFCLVASPTWVWLVWMLSLRLDPIVLERE